MIHTEGLTKTFHRKKEVVEAVKGIDVDVREGELVAFLGPNGAGKSTTLRMLTSLLEPTSGRAEVAGFDIRTHPAQVRSRIGYIGQGNGAASPTGSPTSSTTRVASTACWPPSTSAARRTSWRRSSSRASASARSRACRAASAVVSTWPSAS
ncbi:ATP-binding cassette domain-containing protein [Oerskovia sp. M15]